MESHDWTILGLSVDIVGALLLSVEAITLENVKRLRDMLRRWIEDASRSEYPALFRLFSPQKWMTGENFRARPWLSLVAALAFFLIHMSIASAVIAIAPAETAAELDKNFDKVLFIWLPTSPVWIVGIAVGWLLTAPFWLAFSEVVLLNALLALPVAILSFIDRRTPDGTIGIIGVTLLVLGFVFQMLGA